IARPERDREKPYGGACRPTLAELTFAFAVPQIVLPPTTPKSSSAPRLFPPDMAAPMTAAASAPFVGRESVGNCTGERPAPQRWQPVGRFPQKVHPPSSRI